MLTTLNRKNGRLNSVEPEKKLALTAVNRKIAALTAVSPKKADLTALNWRNSGGNGAELQKWRP